MEIKKKPDFTANTSAGSQEIKMHMVKMIGPSSPLCEMTVSSSRVRTGLVTGRTPEELNTQKCSSSRQNIFILLWIPAVPTNTLF